jgi:hypothetical protein
MGVGIGGGVGPVRVSASVSGRGGCAAFDLDTFIDFAVDVHLDDRQIPLEYAHRSYEQTVNSSKRELRVFTPEEARPSTSASTTCPTSAPSSPTGSPTPSPS